MRQVYRSSRVGRVACAVILSCLLAGGSFVDGFVAAGSAYAADEAEVRHTEAKGGVDQDVPKGSGSDGTESGDAGTSPDDAERQGAATGSAPGGNAASPGTEQKDDQLFEEVALNNKTAAAAPGTGEASVGVTESGQIEGKLPLAGEGSSALAGVIVYERLRYEVRPDGTTVDIAGVDAALEGDVVVPARIRSGAQEYVVTGAKTRAFGDAPRIGSVSLPASIERVADDAFDGCASLASIDVSGKSKFFSSFDGMLFDAAGEKLVRCPEGKAGVASLPKTASVASPDAFDGCALLTGVSVPAENAALASFEGMLCSSDLKTLAFCPAGIGDTVALSAETQVIEAKAFAACELAAITAPGHVREIAPDAFTGSTLANAVVALPAGEDYDARKAVWEAAGFENFAEPAAPGQVAGPAAPEGDADAAASGFAYTLLDDYTLSVAWQGPEDPGASLEIPATAQVAGASYRVSAIAPHAFEGRASIASVKLPAGVSAIGDDAFAGCSNLSSVELSAGVRSVGARAFAATSLADVWLPGSVQAVGERAFAGCSSLSRVVALGAPQVAADALAECAGVTVFCPSASAASWNVGLPAAGNHLAPYGVELASEALQLQEGQSASLLDGGSLETPEGAEVSYAYAAKPISVSEDGTVAAKAAGTSEVAVSLTLDGIELARATRAVEVEGVPEADRPDFVDEAAVEEQVQNDQRPTPISKTVQLTNGIVFVESASVVEDPNLSFSPVTIDGVSGVSVSVTATGRSNIAGAYTLPSEYNGMPVLAVADFGSVPNLHSLIIPDSVVSLGVGAFASCSALESVEIGSGVTSLTSTYCFRGCQSLRTITVHGDVTEVSMGAFSDVPIPGGGGAVYICSPVSVPNYFESHKAVWMEAGFLSYGIMSKYYGILSFDPQGEASTPMSRKVFVGDKVELPADPTKDHHVFDGWWTAPNGGGVQWDFGSTTMPDVDVVLYAKWNPYTYTIAFDGNDATSGSVPNVVAKYDQDVSMPENLFQREGYAFAGWNTMADGSGTSFAAGSTATKPNLSNQNNGSVTLYAQWERTADIEGTDGTCSWTIDASGHLTIFPTDGVSGVLASHASPSGVSWNNHRSLITSVEVKPNVSAKGGMSYLFSDCVNLETANLKNLDTANATSMGALFYMCSKLTTVDVSGFNTAKVTDMNNMFYGCSALKTLDVSGFATAKVRRFEAMFGGCSSLGFIDVSGFNTSSGVAFERMFANCTSLATLDVSGFDTSCAQNFIYMFNKCSALEALDVSGFETSRATSMRGMFYDCSKLTVLDVSGFNTSNVTDMAYMFALCKNVKVLDVSRFDVSKVKEMQAMFHTCSSISKLDLSGFAISNDTSTDYMVYVCSSMPELVVPNGLSKIGKDTFSNYAGILKVYHAPDTIENKRLFTGSVHLMTEEAASAKDKWEAAGYTVVDKTIGYLGKGVFGSCSWVIYEDGLLSVYPTDGVAGTLASSNSPYTVSWNSKRDLITSVVIMPGVSTASGFQDCLFYNCTAMESADLSELNTVNSTTFNSMFSGCSKLASLDVSSLNVSRAVSLGSMFSECSALVSLDVSGWDTSRVTNMASMFTNCSSLTELDVAGFNVSQVTDISSMFEGCSSLTSLDLSHWNTSNIANMSGLFQRCASLTGVEISKFDTSKTTNMKAMFSYASKISHLDLAGFDTSKVTDFSEMFSGCATLTHLDLSSFDSSVAVDMVNMFANGGLSSVTISGAFSKVLSGAFQYTGELDVYAYGAPIKVERSNNHIGFIHLMSQAASSAASKWTAAGYKVFDEFAGAAGDLVFTPIPGTNTCSVRAEDPSRINGHVAIPREVYIESVGGVVAVVEIESGAFSQCSGITSVKVPDTVSRIRASAFSGCLNLVSVNIPDGVGYLAAQAFYNCESLKTIAIPSSVKNIEMASFYDCRSLESVKLSEGLLSIGNMAFASCSDLKTVIIPQGVSSIGDMSFAQSGLCSIVVPSSVRSIGQQAFYGSLISGEILLLRNQDELSIGPNLLYQSGATFYVLPGFKDKAASFITGEGANDVITRMVELSAGTIANLPKGNEGSTTRPVTQPSDMVAPSLIRMPFEWSAPAEASLSVNGRNEATVMYGSNPYNLTGELVYYDASGTRTVVDSTNATVAPITSHKVTFQLQKPGESEPTFLATTYSSTGADGKQYIDDPGVPAVFGYTFAGWVDQGTGNKLDFKDGKAEVTGNVIAVGAYTLKINVTIPTSAQVELDAAGTMKAGALKFESRTPVDLKVTSVKGTRDAEGSEALVPDAEKRGQVKALVKLGDFDSQISLDGSTLYQPNVILGAATQDKATSLEGSVNFNFKNVGAQVNYQANDGAKAFAQLAWTVEAS